jgi:hypothetical protein
MSGRADSRKARGALLFAVAQLLSAAVVTATTLFLSSGLAAAQTDMARLLHDPNVCWVREIDLDQGPRGGLCPIVNRHRCVPRWRPNPQSVPWRLFPHGSGSGLYLSTTQIRETGTVDKTATRAVSVRRRQQLFWTSVWWSGWIAVSEQCRGQPGSTHRLSAVLYA